MKIPTKLSLAVALLSGAVIPASSAEDAATTPADAKVLRVCSAANEQPYSAQDGSGFENKIAVVLANAMGRQPDFVWSQKPAIYLVRDQLDKGNCDVVMGVDDGDDRVATSVPYYRAPYVFIERKDSKLDITSYDSPDIKKTNHIAFAPGGPPQTMLEKLDLYNQNFNYIASLTDFKSKRNQYVRIDPARIVGDVESKNADLGIAFAPEVARLVKDRSDLKMVVVPEGNTRTDGEPVPSSFDQSIAVRKDDKELLGEINAALEKAKPEIHAILEEEGIPLLTAGGHDQKSAPSKT